ncbi:hypothetical protein [Enterococcus gilvus]|uniref:hypothetical protein n=1 Tax=Enterococcus gilvus TaxID=160453 RepID=UPI003ED85702
MNELQRALRFMRSGNRNQIALEEYIHLQERQRSWSKRRRRQLLAQVQQSEVLSFYYQKDDTGVCRILKRTEKRVMKHKKTNQD